KVTCERPAGADEEMMNLAPLSVEASGIAAIAGPNLPGTWLSSRSANWTQVSFSRSENWPGKQDMPVAAAATINPKDVIFMNRLTSAPPSRHRHSQGRPAGR